MKIIELRIKNLRKISDAVLKFDKPLICLYGEVQQGKTTFLDAIKILFSSGFPADLIQHGEKEASIELILENGTINRSFYTDKNGQIKGRSLNAIVANKKLSASQLKKAFNPFQFNQDFLKEMTGVERRKFFIDLFNVDTIEIDAKISETEQTAKDLRIRIKSFGEIHLMKVEKPDLQGLRQKETSEKEKLNRIVLLNRKKNADLKAKWQDDNEKNLKQIQDFNNEQIVISNKVIEAETELRRICECLDILVPFFDTEKASEYVVSLPKAKPRKSLNHMPEPDYLSEKEGCDTTDLENIQSQISDAKVNELKYQNYLQSVEKQKVKEKDQSKLSEIETEIRDLRKKKTSKLSKYGKEIKGLSFNENGELTFEGIANDNLSTSQIVRLGSELSKLYPDSLLDLELIDRAESLGKKIWDFIEKAEREQKTILASIVGEKPAKVPGNVGVFIVEDGKLF